MYVYIHTYIYVPCWPYRYQGGTHTSSHVTHVSYSWLKTKETHTWPKEPYVSRKRAHEPDSVCMCKIHIYNMYMHIYVCQIYIYNIYMYIYVYWANFYSCIYIYNIFPPIWGVSIVFPHEGGCHSRVCFFFCVFFCLEAYVCIYIYIYIYTYLYVCLHMVLLQEDGADVALLTHCNTLQHTATHCNTLQHTATHYNTLQDTATHCNTWSIWGRLSSSRK